LASGIDDIFLEYVNSKQVKNNPIKSLQFPFVLDGFPRSVSQVFSLLKIATREQWNLKIV
jgi:hypothetical protein